MKDRERQRRIIKYVLVACLLAGIVYWGCRIANADTSDENGVLDLTQIEKVRTPDGMPSIVKEYEGFIVDFNPENHTPNYVVWTLQDNETTGSSSRSNKFWTDRDVDGCADTRDYSRSGFDRGHMCPAADQKWSEEAMYDCFAMTNICPQKHELNSGAWKTLEDKERIWARRDSALVIIAGPIYNGDSNETIGNIGVRVPDAFFKVLLAPYASPMRAIAFVYPNMACPGNMSDYSTTVDEVEKITGLDFFYTLPDDIENEIESAASFKEWNYNRKK